ncbi:nuclease-related domain-containing protein [Bhargavaea ullalensis]|uniref:NERD domain-containing protein n=1 Tax=Bhargavaea ullalensis TaxID=1265685 RepID=A0ABV2GD15_9BACL
MGERKYPLELRKLEAALGRMWPGDREREDIEEKRYRVEAGFKGEVMVDQHLRGLRLPVNWTILRDIRLQMHKDYIVQFDTLIVTDLGIWILESKQVRGRLHWHENPRRLERIDDDGTILSMNCPITQLDNQKNALAGWLGDRGIWTTVSGAVVFTRQNVWGSLPEDAPFISVKQIPSYLKREINAAKSAGDHFSFEIIADLIRTHQVEPDPTPAVDLFNLRPGWLKTGLLCEWCSGKLTRISQRTHVCHGCNKPVNGDPYGRALLDFVLVFKTSFTNREFCEFAEISSSTTGRRTLERYPLEVIGKTNRQRYRFVPTLHLDHSGQRLKRRGEG